MTTLYPAHGEPELDLSPFRDEYDDSARYEQHDALVSCTFDTRHPARSVHVTDASQEFSCPRCGARMCGGVRAIEMPWSEVCMHMKIAGKTMWVADAGHNMAQLYDPDTGQPFSFPITHGEAGWRS